MNVFKHYIQESIDVDAIEAFVKSKSSTGHFVGKVPAKEQRKMFGERLGLVLNIDINKREAAVMTKNADGVLMPSHFRRW